MNAVVFDFYGTLAEATGSSPSWDEMFRDLGYEISEKARARLWNEGVDGAEHDEHSRSRAHYVAWQHDRVRRVIAESGVPPGNDDVLLSQILGWFGPERLQAYGDAAPVLRELRRRGFALAICSNWDWDLNDAVAAAGLGDLVDVMVSSAWVGARKPHPRIYAHVLARLEIEPHDILFVGDTWTCDVEGPHRAGMRPVYIRRAHLEIDATAPSTADPLAHRVARITDLEQLLALTL
ncbi:MAG: HAD family hydrolase [Actinomycetota bacterium]